ncbi:MAG: ferredoxin [Thermoprotei archaeon]|nr:MAG: ferredoxin [Thermoprotei archaeon]
MVEVSTESVRVWFRNYGISISVPKGTSILEAAQKANIGIRSVCGGRGYCGKCKVIVRKGRVRHRVSDTTMITDKELSEGYVLACQAFVVEDVEVEIPRESSIGSPKLLSAVTLPKIEPELYIVEKIVKPAELESLTKQYRISKEVRESLLRSREAVIVVNELTSRVLALKSETLEKGIYGLAVDIGTTKVVVSLVNLETSKIIDTDSEFNRQLLFGEDIISRISRAVERKEGLKQLQKAVVETIDNLVEKLCKKHGVKRNEIYGASVAGNTVMTYLFIGINPYPLIKSFKEPVDVPRDPYILEARDLGLGIHPGAEVYVLPCAGRFLGGDVIGDIVTAGISFSESPALLIDIGTNTEVVIGCKEWVIGTTAPAGPAFEGWGLTSGVRAISGAIESVKIDPKTCKAYYKVIGNTKPIGICGSGYIDLLAELFLNGLIDRFGKFYRTTGCPLIRKSNQGFEYVVVSSEESGVGKDIVVTEKDLYNLIDAKSSVCAAISILLKRMYLGINDVKKIYVCGAFGRYLNINSAMAIGMIPEFPQAEVVYIGNGSLGGAYLALVSKRYRNEVERVAKITATIELMLDPNFMEEYEAGFMLPGRKELFPTMWEISRKTKPWQSSA